MPIPQDLYYQLNRTFEAVRVAEKEAARLEGEAQDLRDRARKEIQELYDRLNAATITEKAKP